MTSFFGGKEKVIEKRVCWIDLLIQVDNISIDREADDGITISELKMYSHYYLKSIKNGRYYFNNTKNPEKQMGIGFGSKVSYDFYSVAQAYFPKDYSNYGIFSVTPFISFMLRK